jgi:hypothetical protein
MRTGHQVIAAMHTRYAKTWYRKLSFVQRSRRFTPSQQNCMALGNHTRRASRLTVAPIDMRCVSGS